MSEDPTPKTVLDIRRLSNSRFFLWFALVNAGLVGLISITSLGSALPALGFVVLLGSAGCVFSLFLSRWLAVKAHSIRRIDDGEVPDLAWLVDDVADLSARAGLKAMPQVGVWPGPDANAFATGPSPKRCLVAFSTPLLDGMTRAEVRAVAAHEIAHIANRDMLGMTLLQGVINTFVLLATLPIQVFRLANIFSDSPSFAIDLLAMLVKFLIAAVLTFIGSLFVKAFSRRREYRADAIAARLASPEDMTSALGKLAQLSDEDRRTPQAQAAFAVFKINGRGLLELLSTHPTIEKRITALEDGTYSSQVADSSN